MDEKNEKKKEQSQRVMRKGVWERFSSKEPFINVDGKQSNGKQ